MLAVLPSSNNFSMVFALHILGLCFGFLYCFFVVGGGGAGGGFCWFAFFFFMAQGMSEFFPKYFRHVQERI